MDYLGLTESQVRRIVENILANSPGFTISDLLGRDVRIIATRGHAFRQFGVVRGYSSDTALLVLVTNHELGFTQPVTPAETRARAQALGLRIPTEMEFALMQASWDHCEELAVQVGTTLYSLYTCRSLEQGPEEGMKMEDTFGPEKQWVFVQS